MLVQPVSADLHVPQVRLDFLRGIAAIYVVINHMRGAFWIGGEKLLAHDPSPLNYMTVAALQFTSLGEEAVILFFVLSGFAMAHSVRISSSTPRFYAKRVVRIWPPYIAATVLALAIGAIIGDNAVRNRVWHILFYDRPGGNALVPQFWSLPYEVLFYLLCPLILANERRIQWVFLIGLTGALVAFAIKGPILNPWNSLPLDFLSSELLLFSCGAVAYYNLNRLPKIKPWALAVLSFFGICSVLAIKHSVGANNLISNTFMMGLSVMAIRNLPDIKRFNLGYCSYSIYIFHYAFIALISFSLTSFGIAPASIVNPFAWILGVPPILFVCSVLYFVTERISNREVARIRRSPPSRPRI